MSTLIAFEFRKIVNRKVLWVVLALGLAMWAQVRGSSIVHPRTIASAQNVREIYARYEGQVLTDALKAQIQRDLDNYIAAHADSFRPMPMDDSGYSEGGLVPNEVATDMD